MDFKTLNKWIITENTFSVLPEGWRVSEIGKLVTRVKTRIKVIDTEKYEMVGVRWYGEGAFHRETVLGSDLSSSYVYPLVSGHFIYNRLFGWKSSFAIVDKSCSNKYVSNEFPRYEVGEELMPEYLYLYCLSDKMQKEILRRSVGSSAVSRNRLKEEIFESIEILLPPIEVQQRIIKRWNDNVDNKNKLKQEIIGLEDKIYKEIIKKTSIKFNCNKKRKKVFSTDFKSINRWGVEFNRHSLPLGDLMLSQKYPLVSLTSIALINPSDRIKIPKSCLISFVPMESVSDKTGEIFRSIDREYSEVSTGYTRFKEGDVIFAKITPCMQNGKCAVARGLKNGIGIGSTEFHVIRVKDNKVVLPEYIWLLLRLPEIRSIAKRYFIGSAGQQRVPAMFFEELRIPLLPVNIQECLVIEVEAIKKEMQIKTEEMDTFENMARNELEQNLMGIE